MFRLSVTFDTDAINQNNPHYDAGRPAFDYDRQLCELFRYLADIGAKANAFVRIDQQLEKYFGYLHVFEKVIAALDKSGRPEVEIGWHPHIYEKTGEGYKITADEGLIAEMLREIYSRVREVGSMRCVRLGGAQGGNQLVKALDQMGFKVDSSAIAGRSRSDAHCHYDWSRCGNAPYHPSLEDYQQEKALNYRILEVPITSVPLSISRDGAGKSVVVHPCFRPELFEKVIVRNKKSLEELGFCVLFFHPDELMEGYSDNALLSGFGNFRRNLEFFRHVMGEVEFVTLSELA